MGREERSCSVLDGQESWSYSYEAAKEVSKIYHNPCRGKALGKRLRGRQAVQDPNPTVKTLGGQEIN